MDGSPIECRSAPANASAGFVIARAMLALRFNVLALGLAQVVAGPMAIGGQRGYRSIVRLLLRLALCVLLSTLHLH